LIENKLHLNHIQYTHYMQVYEKGVSIANTKKMNEQYKHKNVSHRHANK